MDYLKQNHLSILIIVWLVFSPLLLGGSSILGVAANVTTVGNPWVFGSTVTITGVPTFTADAVFNGGNGGIVVTNSNTATSSIQVGCVQTTATSTATPVKLVITSVSTTTSTFGPITSGLAVVAAFGTCP